MTFEVGVPFHGLLLGRTPLTPSATVRNGWVPRCWPPRRISCRAVVHIGDSTSEGMVSPDYLPNPAQRLFSHTVQTQVKSIYRKLGASSRSRA